MESGDDKNSLGHSLAAVKVPSKSQSTWKCISKVSDIGFIKRECKIIKQQRTLCTFSHL